LAHQAVVASWFLGMAAAAVGCATSTPLPAPPPPLLPNSASVSEVPDLRILADGIAWKGDPALAEGLTPVWVSIEHPTGISYLYADLALIGSSGIRYKAMPATELKPIATTTRLVPKHERGGGTTFVPERVPYELPRTDLMEKALRLTPEGRGQGFLYFGAAAQREADVWFELTVVNASTRQSLGTFAAPLTRWQNRGGAPTPLPGNKPPAPCSSKSSVCTEQKTRSTE